MPRCPESRRPCNNGAKTENGNITRAKGGGCFFWLYVLGANDTPNGGQLWIVSLSIHHTNCSHNSASESMILHIQGVT